jgi:hypothetical protein
LTLFKEPGIGNRATVSVDMLLAKGEGAVRAREWEEVDSGALGACSADIQEGHSIQRV